MGGSGHRDLVVWRQAMDLAQRVYEVTRTFPREETYGLTAQMWRAAISIPSNIAEGSGRATRADYLQFLRIAKGSLRELETQIELAQRIGLIQTDSATQLESLAISVAKLLDRLIRSLSPPKPAPPDC